MMFENPMEAHMNYLLNEDEGFYDNYKKSSKRNAEWSLESGDNQERHLIKITSMIWSIEDIEKYQNGDDLMKYKFRIIAIKFTTMLHMRAFIFSKISGTINQFTIGGGKAIFSGGNIIAPTNKIIYKMLKEHMEKRILKKVVNYEGNIEKNMKKQKNKYYKILMILTRFGIFDEHRKKIIGWCFDNKYFKYYIQSALKKFNNGRAKTTYKYWMKFNPKRQLEFTNTYLTGINDGTTQMNVLNQIYKGSWGQRQYAFEPTEFNFKQITERQVKNSLEWGGLRERLKPRKKLRKLIEKQTKNPFIIGFYGGQGEKFDDNMNINKKISFENEKEALDFKHKQSKRFEFIYKYFNKYKNIYNQRITLKKWSWNSTPSFINKKHKIKYKKEKGNNRIDPNNCVEFTIEAKKDCLFTNKKQMFDRNGIQVPQYCFNNVKDPYYINDNIYKIQHYYYSEKLKVWFDADRSGDLVKYKTKTYDINDETDMLETDCLIWKIKLGVGLLKNYWWNGNGYKAIWNKLPNKVNGGKQYHI